MPYKKFIHVVPFITQQERIKNLSPEIKKELEELERSGYQIEDYSYFGEPQGELIYWEEHEKTLNKEKITELIIKPNEFKFKDYKLILKDYPNLKTLYACGLDLRKLEIDCPSLDNLYLTNNKLTSIDLSKVYNLVNLLINDNEIQRITGLNKLTELEDLRINKNYLAELDVSGLTNLWCLDCSNNFIEKLFLNNQKLTILDADVNFIEDLKFPPLPELAAISLRQNVSAKIGKIKKKDKNKSLVLRSPKLIFLDYHRSNIKQVNHALGLENPNLLTICNSKSYTNPDGTFNPDVATPWEDLFNQLHSKRKAKQKGWTKPAPPPAEENSSDQEPIITDPTQLTNDYPELWAKNKDEEELTITTEGLTGTMIFDGFTKLRKINVGNNSLSYLVIKNCPQLHTLRYAYNALRHDAWIDNCPNLTTIDKYGYDGGVAWDNKELPPDGKEKFNQELNTKKSESTESEQHLIQVTQLIQQIEAALTQNNLTQASELITELKELAEQPNSLIQADQLNATIAGLASRLSAQTQLVDSHQKNNWPLIIGSFFIFPITLGIVVLLVKKWVKKRK
jgi:hypothetical protein